MRTSELPAPSCSTGVCGVGLSGTVTGTPAALWNLATTVASILPPPSLLSSGVLANAGLSVVIASLYNSSNISGSSSNPSNHVMLFSFSHSSASETALTFASVSFPYPEILAAFSSSSSCCFSRSNHSFECIAAFFSSRTRAQVPPLYPANTLSNSPGIVLIGTGWAESERPPAGPDPGGKNPFKKLSADCKVRSKSVDLTVNFAW
mmetsp:Transcript_16293/g.31608  ORF Transcript_16293/g.31608 Transcript_16293/m.31608 type:complete len:206 (+) Transcript_16293:801-1418(+)